MFGSFLGAESPVWVSLAPEGEMFGSFFLVMLNYVCGDCLKTTMPLAGSCA